jgi:uncharacterized protein (DUF736 family)
MNKIGGLWLNTSQKGVKYFAGSIKVGGVDQKIIIFKNTQKQEGEKYPDYNIYEQEPKQGKKEQPKQESPPVDEVPF